VADATVRACSHAALACGTDVVVLSGGVWQNRRLTETTAAGLRSQGLRVLIPERLPVNDGGISYGQAAVAVRRMATNGR
jgi:hydrogenase maturation protein HypF